LQYHFWIKYPVGMERGTLTTGAYLTVSDLMPMITDDELLWQ